MDGGYRRGLVASRRQLNYAKSCSYDCSSMSIPSQVPSGKKWVQDAETGDYQLVDKEREEKEEKEEKEEEVDDEEGEGGSLKQHRINRYADTLEGLCLKFKLSKRVLQKANNFTGNDLSMAPEILVIPNANVSKSNVVSSSTRSTDRERSIKLRDFCQLFPDLGSVEAKLYLETASWDFEIASKVASQDIAWESSDAAISRGKSQKKFNARFDETENFIRNCDGRGDIVGDLVGVQLSEKKNK